MFESKFVSDMGKLGKKARKFSKKNLQSVLRRNRKLNSKFNKKKTSKSKLSLTYFNNSIWE